MPAVERVLLAEDDGELRSLLAGAFGRNGCQVIAVADGPGLLDVLWSRQTFDLIVSDMQLPGCPGIEVLEGLRDECEPSIGETPVVLIAAAPDHLAAAEARRLGAALVGKPFDPDELSRWALDFVRARAA